MLFAAWLSSFTLCSIHYRQNHPVLIKYREHSRKGVLRGGLTEMDYAPQEIEDYWAKINKRRTSP